MSLFPTCSFLVSTRQRSCSTTPYQRLSVLFYFNFWSIELRVVTEKVDEARAQEMRITAANAFRPRMGVSTARWSILSLARFTRTTRKKLQPGKVVAGEQQKAANKNKKKRTTKRWNSRECDTIAGVGRVAHLYFTFLVKKTLPRNGFRRLMINGRDEQLDGHRGSFTRVISDRRRRRRKNENRKRDPSVIMAR